MDEKYRSVIKNIDKLPNKKNNRKTNEEYEKIKKEIDQLLADVDEENK